MLSARHVASSPASSTSSAWVWIHRTATPHHSPCLGRCREVHNREMRTWIATLLLCGTAHADVTVTIDANAGQHPISPLIYGMNFPDSAQLAAGVPLARWGGNSTSRYNYQIDVSNSANDYYFENTPGCWSTAANYCNPAPSNPKTNSGAIAFITAAQAAGAMQLVTMPTIGYVAKGPPQYAHPFTCGCPKTFNANQDSYDPYDANCGNCKVGGNYITPPATPLTSTAITTQWDSDWVTYLTGKFGASNGKRIYALDNEPALWSSTQHDVHPARLGYDELWQRMRDHAVAILAADPTATISGPAERGWLNYLCSAADVVSNGCSASSPDRAAHGGEELDAWLLDQAKAYEQANGKRILHYLDLHYYPQGGDPPEVLRSLWDPTYTDPSYINAKIRLIPRMRDWVDSTTPGRSCSSASTTSITTTNRSAPSPTPRHSASSAAKASPPRPHGRHRPRRRRRSARTCFT